MKYNTATDIVLCAVPRMGIYYPPGAPAILKAYLNTENISSVVLDFVLLFHKKYFGTKHWERIINWFVAPHIHDKLIVDLLDKEIESWVDKIFSYNPTWIGISVFSYESHKITKYLIYKLKSRNLNCKIVLGGNGITDGSKNYADDLYQNGLIDKYILGDGEGQILELFNKPNTFRFEQSIVPDWSDYNLQEYALQKNKESKEWTGFGNYLYTDAHEILTLPVTGSRGCVRRCSFCDIPSLWPQFRFRTANSILTEIIQNYKKYNVTRFHFTDSLINGNVKVFRELCNLLSSERKANNYTFTFTGQYICRNAARETDEQYKIMAAAGIKVLEVGIESGSEAVRYHMGKKFSNNDIRILVERCSKNNIKIVLLLIVGYPTETEENFQETLDLLTELQPYIGNTIIEACLGHTLTVDPVAALASNPEVYWVKDTDDHLHWMWKSNPKLTLNERIDRRHRILKHSISLGYISPTSNQEVLYLKSQVDRTVA